MQPALIERQHQEIGLLRERIRQLEDAMVPFGVVIETRWGQGYALRDRLRYAAKRQSQEVAA